MASLGKDTSTGTLASHEPPSLTPPPQVPSVLSTAQWLRIQEANAWIDQDNRLTALHAGGRGEWQRRSRVGHKTNLPGKKNGSEPVAVFAICRD